MQIADKVDQRFPVCRNNRPVYGFDEFGAHVPLCVAKRIGLRLGGTSRDVSWMHREAL